LLAISIGLLSGAVAVRYLFPAPPPSTHEIITSDSPDFANRRYGFGIYDLKPDTLLNGWHTPENWGTRIRQAKATFRLPNSEPAGEDIELILDARIKVKSRADPKKHARLLVRCNGVDIGSWPISTTSPQLQQRFIIPQSVFNRNTPAIIELEESQAGAEVAVGLRAFELRVPPLLRPFRGSLDGCDGRKVWGWAVANGLPVPVIASVDGEPVEAAFVNVLRPDLEANAFPNSAGFELTLANPVPAGSVISVSFYGSEGQSLTNSPCRQ
jgi:hypothetical protein